MEEKQPRRTANRRIVGLAATFALCGGWSASAVSATTASIECDDLIRDLRSLESPAETLSVTPVDHVAIEPVPSDIELLDAENASSETAAPFLFLTPRVASVLRDIFEFSQESADEEVIAESASSPVAESVDSERVPNLSELLEQSGSAISTGNGIDLPRFQQRMFRTDI